MIPFNKTLCLNSYLLLPVQTGDVCLSAFSVYNVGNGSVSYPNRRSSARRNPSESEPLRRYLNCGRNKIIIK